MTDEEIKRFVGMLRHTQMTPSQDKAADLIEQLQRERDEARDRLAEVGKGDYYEGVEEGYNCGFRAGIEAAYETSGQYHQITHIREAIRNLTEEHSCNETGYGKDWSQ